MTLEPRPVSMSRVVEWLRLSGELLWRGRWVLLALTVIWLIALEQLDERIWMADLAYSIAAPVLLALALAGAMIVDKGLGSLAGAANRCMSVVTATVVYDAMMILLTAVLVPLAPVLSLYAAWSTSRRLPKGGIALIGLYAMVTVTVVVTALVLGIIYLAGSGESASAPAASTLVSSHDARQHIFEAASSLLLSPVVLLGAPLFWCPMALVSILGMRPVDALIEGARGGLMSVKPVAAAIGMSTCAIVFLPMPIGFACSGALAYVVVRDIWLHRTENSPARAVTGQVPSEIRL